MREDSGVSQHGHYGSTGVYWARMLIFPGHDLGFIVAANCSPKPGSGDLLNEALNEILAAHIE